MKNNFGIMLNKSMNKMNEEEFLQEIKMLEAEVGGELSGIYEQALKILKHK